MKETKVYVDELPVNCDKCKYYTQFDNGMGCMIIQELRPMGEKENYIQPDCPLVDIKTHDRELVKEVCEKIKNLANERTSIDTGMLDMVYFDDVVDKIEKEFENER